MEIPIEHLLPLLEELTKKKPPIKCTEPIEVKYTDDNGEEQILHFPSLEELVVVMKKNWADSKQELPKNLRIEIKPLPSSFST